MIRTALAVLFLFAGLTLPAQFNYTIEMGINASKYAMEAPDQIDVSSRLGLYVGAHTKYELKNNWAIGFDIEASQRGVDVARSGVDTSSDIDFRFTYLDLQPYFIYKLHDNIAVGAGGYIGFNVSEASREEDIWLSTNALDYISSTDYGLLFNCRFEYNKTYLKIEYNHGLNSVNNFIYTDGFGESLGDDLQLRNIQIGVGYYFK